jgi:hypothetical protein
VTICQRTGARAEDAPVHFARSGIDIDTLGDQLQEKGANAFVKPWSDLMEVISSKCAEIKKSSQAPGASWASRDV